MNHDDQEYQLTDDGLLQAIDMHQRLLAGETIEQVADSYGFEATAVQIVLAMLYELIDLYPDLVAIEVPDDLSGL